ncbi:hypothetical protein D9M69_548390 [compost metagenome]
MPLPGYMEIQGQDQGAAVGGSGTVDKAGKERPVFQDRHLKPQGSARIRSNVLQRALATDGQRIGHAEFRGSARCLNFAVRIQESRASCRRHGHRHCNWQTEHGAGSAAAIDIGHYPLPELHLLEIRFVGAIGTLRPRPRIDVVIKHPGQALTRQ